MRLLIGVVVATFHLGHHVPALDWSNNMHNEAVPGEMWITIEFRLSVRGNTFANDSQFQVVGIVELL